MKSADVADCKAFNAKILEAILPFQKEPFRKEKGNK